MPPPNLSQLPGPWPPPSSGSCRILMLVPSVVLHTWARLGVARAASNAKRLVLAIRFSVAALGLHKTAVGKDITLAAAAFATSIGRVARAAIGIFTAINLIRHWSYLAFL